MKRLLIATALFGALSAQAMAGPNLFDAGWYTSGTNAIFEAESSSFFSGDCPNLNTAQVRYRFSVRHNVVGASAYYSSGWRIWAYPNTTLDSVAFPNGALSGNNPAALDIGKVEFQWRCNATTSWSTYGPIQTQTTQWFGN